MQLTEITIAVIRILGMILSIMDNHHMIYTQKLLQSSTQLLRLVLYRFLYPGISGYSEEKLWAYLFPEVFVHYKSSMLDIQMLSFFFGWTFFLLDFFGQHLIQAAFNAS